MTFAAAGVVAPDWMESASSLPASLISSHGPPGSASIRATFNLVFIDAHSGDFVFGTAGS